MKEYTGECGREEEKSTMEISVSEGDLLVHG